MAEAKAQRWAHADPVKVDSKHYTVEMENEKVRVLRNQLKQKSEMQARVDQDIFGYLFGNRA